MRDLDYLKLLAKQFPSEEKTCIEIANLNSILTLPKGTAYFFSDLHGEHESFIHLLRSASGNILSKLKFIYKDKMSDEEILDFSELIYYPEKKTIDIDFNDKKTYDLQKKVILNLIPVVKDVASKYSKSKVRKSIKMEYAYLLDELLYKENDRDNVKKEIYYDEIVNSIVSIGLSRDFIICLCKLIQKLSIDSLHIIGDIFDRGPRHDKILDELLEYNNVDIEWGNHDIEWIGAYVGNETLMINALRIAIRYNCYDMLEDGYGISLRALNDFAARTYENDKCELFMPSILDENKYDVVSPELTAKIQKALTIIMFKLEGQLIKKHPEYEMNDRIMLERINYDDYTIDIDGKTYKLLDNYFPTIDKKNPLKLTDEEEKLVRSFKTSFSHSNKLSKHMKFLIDNGSMYKIFNGNLLYHGVIPMEPDKSYTVFSGFDGKQKVSCKSLMDYFEKVVRDVYKDKINHIKESDNIDAIYYMWCGKNSPLFGKDKIRTFEICFIDDADVQKENKNSYYKYYQDESVVNDILQNFGLGENGHIINGHVPVKTKDGENPIKANGKLYIIDGGLSKAYHEKTGIAGYTLIIDSVHISLASHRPFEKGKPNSPITKEVADIAGGKRLRIRDTDKGKEILKRIEDLKELLDAYRNGLINYGNL